MRSCITKFDKKLTDDANFDIIFALLLIITVMKTQLQRILKSDLSEYKIAVSEHISNLDQFEECLTERSNFMLNFNQMLKQQLERINKQPPSQFDNIQLPQTFRQRQTQILGSVGNTVYSMIGNTQQSKFQYKNANDEVNKQKPCKCSSMAQKIERIKEKNIKQLSQFANNLRIYMKQQMEITKRKILYEMSSNVQNLASIISKHYHKKISILEAEIQKMKKQQNNPVNNQYKTQYDVCIKQKIAELEQRSKQSKQNKQHKDNTAIKTHKLQTDYQLPYFSYSPIWNITHSQPSQQCQQSAEYSKYTLTEKDHQSSEFKVMPSNHKVISLQTESQMPQMTVANTKEATWKHFICDLESTTLKEIKLNQRPKEGKENIITTIGRNQSPIAKNYKHTSPKLHQPNLPTLLRKNISDKSYDIPAVRSIVVSYPPVQEGFSALKLGNEVIYKGMWKHRRFHGKGKLTLPEYSYEGDFQQGLFHGRGTLKIGCFEFIGQFIENRAEGQGKLKIGTKQVTGRWKNNLLVERY